MTWPTPSICAISSTEASLASLSEPKAEAIAFAAVGPTCRIDSATIFRHSSFVRAACNSATTSSIIFPGFEGDASSAGLPWGRRHFGFVQAARTRRKSPVGSPLTRTSCHIHTSWTLSAASAKSPASEESAGVWGAGIPKLRWMSGATMCSESIIAPSWSTTPSSRSFSGDAKTVRVRPSSSSMCSLRPFAKAMSASGRRRSGSVSHSEVSSPSASTSRAARLPM